MKRFASVTIALCIASVFANAQWKIDSFQHGDPAMSLHQIIPTEKSNLIYASIEVESSKEASLFIGRQAYVKVGAEKFKILNSVNIPLKDEADMRYALIGLGHQEINFVVEFEKFPVESGFDMVCDPDDDGLYSFNGHNIQVSPIDEDKLLNTERFLNSAMPVIRGYYNDNGTKYLYYIRNDVFITVHAGFFSDGFTSDPLFYVDIVNNSDHGIMFDFSKVYAEAVKKKKNGEERITALTKYSPDSYDDFIQQSDYAEAKAMTEGFLGDLDHILYREGNKAETGSLERAGWRALEALNKRAIANRAEEYLKEHPREHAKALRSQSIRPGEAVSGYIATKKKNVDEIRLHIPMDGYDYMVTLAL